jgi:hypothetical protein
MKSPKAKAPGSIPKPATGPAKRNTNHAMKIHLPTLYLAAAVLKKQPLELLITWAMQSKTSFNKTCRNLRELKSIMPDAILEKLTNFLEELFNNRGGPIQFYFRPKKEEIDTSIAKWTKMISKDGSWLEDSPPEKVTEETW